ncbi:hypothetical protein GCM10009665_47400 [Kitasatospora nipponensis]|uniref:Uncharacterized protein n=1 Tax=Kitasatospora nipponensis TaxID=258049 RepID=A0ABN1WLS3_9ACTN
MSEPARVRVRKTYPAATASGPSRAILNTGLTPRSGGAGEGGAGMGVPVGCEGGKEQAGRTVVRLRVNIGAPRRAGNGAHRSFCAVARTPGDLGTKYSVTECMWGIDAAVTCKQYQSQRENRGHEPPGAFD